MEQDKRTSGQGDRRRVLLVAKYAGVLAVSAWLYRAAADYAIAERGYRAAGGEALLLLLPVVYYIIERMVRDWIADIRAAREAGRRGIK